MNLQMELLKRFAARLKTSQRPRAADANGPDNVNDPESVHDPNDKARLSLRYIKNRLDEWNRNQTRQG